MRVEKTGSSSLKILAPAKLNLFLEVTGKRPDGYHELDTVMHTVDLCDELEILKKGRSSALRATGREMGPLEQNLALRAARLFSERTETDSGFEIRLDKRIPVGAGLGGGSSDAAAVLLGCNLLAGSPLDRGALKDLAAELGSDIPFFLHCGTAVCRGRGELVEPLTSVPSLSFLVIYPGFSISTRAVYENLNLDLTKRKKNSSLIEALSKPDCASVINAYIFNRLERPALDCEPSLTTSMEDAKALGFPWLTLTGSGSAFFQAQVGKEASGIQSELFNIDCHWESYLVKSSPMLRF
jgi:4-diphosphocytidyl-2-C-methyl-D-erythritol kinase